MNVKINDWLTDTLCVSKLDSNKYDTNSRIKTVFASSQFPII